MFFFKNLNNNSNKEFSNKKMIESTKYFKMPSKTIFNKENKKINIFKSEDYSINKNESILNNEKNINIINTINNKSINNKNTDNHLIIPIEINYKINYNNKKSNNNFENYINIHSNSNESKINNIKKRKLELLKFLDFSSSIGNNNSK